MIEDFGIVERLSDVATDLCNKLVIGISGKRLGAMEKKAHVGGAVTWRAWALGLSLCITALAFPATALPEVYLKVGILSEPKFLNPFRVADAWTKRVTMLIYQPLYLIDPSTLNLIPWLAEDQPQYDPEKKTLTFHLRAMSWDDGTEFTAEDVAFTAEVYKKFRVPGEYPYWDFVESVRALDKRTVQITVERPMAVLHTRTLTSWVVQKKKWNPVIKKAEERLQELVESEEVEEQVEAVRFEGAVKEALGLIQAYRVKNPTGLGPFKFKEWQEGRFILLERNEHFFGRGKTIHGKAVGPYIDGVIFKRFDTQMAAASALKKGDIDFLWKGVSHALVKDLTQSPQINILKTLDSGYRYLGFNLRRPPMKDAAFRQALAYLIDKDVIVKRVLHDSGQRLDTFVPPGNAYYFNPNTPTYGKGMAREQRIRVAFRILTAAGYRWQKPPVDAAGKVRKGEGLLAPGEKKVLPLTLITPTPDYDVEMASAGQLIQQWLKDFGVLASLRPMAFSGLLHRIRNEKVFDMYLLGWRNLSVDPDYLRKFFYSSDLYPNRRNYVGYNDPQLDRLADLQARTLDRRKRRAIVWQMQARLMKDLPYIPLYVPLRLEGIRTDRFEGWVKGSSGGVGNTWTFCLLRPAK